MAVGREVDGEELSGYCRKKWIAKFIGKSDGLADETVAN